MTDIMKWIAKNGPAILLLLAGIVASIASFYSSQQDSEQKDNIENLGKENLKLSSQIDELSKLNNEISKRVETLTSENNKISSENLSLSEKSQKIIFEVQELNKKSQHLIAIVNSRALYESEVNVVTGNIELDFTKFSTNSDITITLGSYSNTKSIKMIMEMGFHTVSVYEAVPFQAKFKDGKLLLSLDVFDLNGNLIAEIKDNAWRPNKNFTGKFNYDNKGFEVINNQGEVAVSFNIISQNHVVLKGVLPIKQTNYIFIAGDRNFTWMPKENTVEALEAEKFERKPYSTVLREVIDRNTITPIFYYTGKNWLHSRVSSTKN